MNSSSWGVMMFSSAVREHRVGGAAISFREIQFTIFGVDVTQQPHYLVSVGSDGLAAGLIGKPVEIRRCPAAVCGNEVAQALGSILGSRDE
jgi:hypothetical protein